MPKFAANLTWLFHEHEFIDRFAAAGEFGFQAVECQFPYAWEREILADRRAASELELVMFNTPPGSLDDGEYGLAALPGREQEFKESITHALSYADALDCRMLHILAGIVPEKQDRERYCSTYLANLKWAAEECGKSDVFILLEPINTIERPGYLISTTTDARRFIQQLDTDNIAMQFDFHNAQLMEGNLTTALQVNLEYIRHMQIAGVPDRAPPDKGEMNYDYLFELIDQLGYDGWVGCEFRSGQSTKDALGWAKKYGIG